MSCAPRQPAGASTPTPYLLELEHVYVGGILLGAPVDSSS